MKRLKEFIPLYGMVMLCLMLVLNTVTYFGTRLFTTNMEHHVLWSSLDERIPFCSAFIIFYYLAYIQWIVGYVLIARSGKKNCYKYLCGEMIAKGICLLCFVLYPTTIIRPDITGKTIFDELVRGLYVMDSPDNLFPSIHCLESWVCLRTAFAIKGLPSWYKGASVVMTVGVFLSTVFLKQHVVADMVGAVVAVELGFLIMKVIVEKKRVENE